MSSEGKINPSFFNGELGWEFGVDELRLDKFSKPNEFNALTTVEFIDGNLGCWYITSF